MPQAFTSCHFIYSRLGCIQLKYLLLAILFILGQTAQAQAFISCHFFNSRLGCICLKHSLLAISFLLGQAAYSSSIHFLQLYFFQVQLHTTRAFTSCHFIYSSLGCIWPKHFRLGFFTAQAFISCHYIDFCHLIYSRLGCIQPRHSLLDILFILSYAALRPRHSLLGSR